MMGSSTCDQHISFHFPHPFSKNLYSFLFIYVKVAICLIMGCGTSVHPAPDIVVLESQPETPRAPLKREHSQHNRKRQGSAADLLRETSLKEFDKKRRREKSLKNLHAALQSELEQHAVREDSATILRTRSMSSLVGRSISINT